MSKHSRRGPEWEAQRRRILDRDGWTCAYCGKELVGDDATADHILPVVAHPDHDYNDDELVAACRTCNGRKSDRLAVRLDWRSPRWFQTG